MEKDKEAGDDVETKLTEGADDQEQTQPVTIEIGADGEGTVIEVESKDKESGSDDGDDKPKKKKGRYQRRLDVVTARASEAERTSSRLAAELEEARAEADKQKKRADEADEAALANYEARCKAEVDKTQKDLEEAIAGGDSAKIAAATVASSKAAAEYGRVEAYRKTQKPKDEDADEGDDDGKGKDTRQTQQPQQRVDPRALAWAEENPWFVTRNADGTPNPEFRPYMHAYAMKVAKDMEDEYKKAGKPLDDDYFDAITAKTLKKFPEEGFGDGTEDGDDIDDDPPPARKTPVMKKDGDTPALRSQSNGNGAPKPGKERIELTSDQIEMVKFNIANDVYARKSDGSRLTLQEGMVRMAKAVQEDRKRQKMQGN